MGKLPLPAAPEQITPDWLSAALREAGILRDGAVEAVGIELIGHERGFSGVLARLDLRYRHLTSADAALTAPTLIAKFPTARRETPSTYTATHTTTQRANSAVSHQLFERAAREVHFYQQIAPETRVSVPRLYFAAVDEATGRVVLLLEDLRMARAGDVLQGCTPGEAESILRAIVLLHARWWAHDTANRFPWLREWVGDPLARQQRFNQQVGTFLQGYGDQLAAPMRGAILDLLARLRTGYAGVLTRLATAPATLIHADLHLDNVLFHPAIAPPVAPSVAPLGSAEEPRPVVLLDWQSIARGPAVVDLTFLAGSLSVEQRRASGELLLRAYHEQLVALGVTGYSLEQLREHYRLALLWQLAGTVGWLSAPASQHAQGRERELIRAALGDGRLLTALLDEEVAALLPD